MSTHTEMKTKTPVQISDDDPNLLFVPEKEASTLKAGLVDIILDKWWLRHPEKGLVFYKMHKSSPVPLCNANIKVMNAFLKNYPWAEAVKVDVVYRRVRVRDYV